MTISLGCDHGGFDLKEHIKAYLEGKGHTVKDCGTYSKESCDYPLFGAAAAKAVADGECERGVVICTDPLAAEMTRRHNNANMLAMGAGMLGRNMAERIVDVFLSTEFEGGRHQRRVDEISDLEA